MNELRGNTLVARFGGYKTVTTASLWQYDYGQKLKLEGLSLPEAYEVHFSKSDVTGSSITQIGTAEGVTIPDELLLSSGPIYVWVYLHNGDSDGETEYKMTIPVSARVRPTNDEPTPVEQSAITEAIAALNVAVEETAADVLEVEGYTFGTQNGEPVSSDSLYFENNAKHFKEASESAKDASVLARQQSESARDASVTAKNQSISAKQAAESARDVSVNAKNDAVSARQAAESAKSDSIAAKLDAVAAKNSAELFQNGALSARDDAVAAKTAAVAAKSEAVSAKNSAAAFMNGAISAKNEAATAESGAVAAKEASIEAMEDAVSAKYAAEEARDEFLGLNVTVQTLPAGSAATVSYDSGLMSFGIPRGNTGERGAKGETGATGATGPKGEKGTGVPEGGTTGQVLKKKSGSDYDTEWTDEVLPVRFYVCRSGEYMATTKMPIIANPDPATFYLVPDGTGSDSLIEWINLGGTWEKFGSTRIDLSNYVQKTDIATTSDPGLVKPNAGYGTRMGDGSFQNTIMIAKADDGEVKSGANNFKPIVPSSEHAATFFGLAKAAGDSTQATSNNPVGTYTDGAKTAIKEMLGIEESEPGVIPVTDVEVNGVSVLNNGVAEIPLADDSNAGVLKVAERYGLRMDADGSIKIYAASDSVIKQASNSYRPVGASHIDVATFYGLAKAAGDLTQAASSNAVGTYTDGAKAAIQTMLGLVNLIRSTSITGIWTGTQAEYDLLTPDANTLYLIEEV